MSSKAEALQRLKAFFELYSLNYMTIGGLASTIWGRPRLTYDADVKLTPGELSLQQLVALVGQTFQFRLQDPLAFARRTYVLPVWAMPGIPADLVVGVLPYETQAVERAVLVDVEGVQLPVCTAEDLIIHKAISERERDWSDIEGVLLRQREKLDQAYVETWLERFAHELGRPQIVSRYRQLRAQLGL